MKEKRIMAFDIGGTNIKYASLSLEGEILSSGEMPTEAARGVEALVEKINQKIEEEAGLAGLAFSATGQIDFYQGRVVGGNPIIPGWIGFALRSYMEERYGLPTVLENDVNAAALGEAWKGRGRDLSNFLCLTIGTGIGGAIVLEGDLYRGASAIAGEFGRLPLAGCPGKYEDYASMSALTREMEAAYGRRLHGREIFEAYWAGKEEKGIVAAWISKLAEGLTSIMYLWNPSHIILGGGVTHQGEALREAIWKEVKEKIGRQYTDCCQLDFAELGNRAGLLGATKLLLDQLKKQEEQGK